MFPLPQTLRWFDDCFDANQRLHLPPFEPGKTIPKGFTDAYVNSKLKPEELESCAFSTSSVCGIEDKEPSSDNLVGTYETSVPGAVTSVFDPAQEVLARSQDSITRMTGIAFVNNPTKVPNVTLTKILSEYLNIDSSQEAVIDSEYRRGLTIVLHGPPSSGKTKQAKILSAKYHNIPILHLDTILKDALYKASTDSAIEGRKACLEAAAAKALESSNEPPKKQGSKEKEPPPDLSVAPLSPIPFKVDPMEGTEVEAPDGTLLPTNLPEEIIIDILTGHLHNTACHKGVIIDGMISQFCSNQNFLWALMLRLLGNRKHLYVVHLEMELEEIKERLEQIKLQALIQEKKKENEKKEAKMAEMKRIEALLELEEDEYEALSVEEQEEIDSIRLQRKKEKIQKKKLLEEEKRREEELRLEEERRENERKKKGKKSQQKGTQPAAKPQATPAAAAGGGGAGGVATVAIPPQTSRPVSAKSSGILHQPSVITASGISVAPSVDSPGANTPKHKQPKRKISPKISPLTESANEMVRLEEVYAAYKAGLLPVKGLLEAWDREYGGPKPKKAQELEDVMKTPSRRSKSKKEVEPQVAPPPLEDEDKDGIPINCMALNAYRLPEEITSEICSSFPSPVDILEELGIGPSGPPISQDSTFQVCPYPLKRTRPESEKLPSNFTFIISSPDDVYVCMYNIMIYDST